MGQFKQKQEEFERLMKANSKLNQDNVDLSAYLDRNKQESDRLSSEYERIKVLNLTNYYNRNYMMILTRKTSSCGMTIRS